MVSRGSALVDIEVVGTQMHSNVSDRFDPVNATVEMAWLIQKMASEFHDDLTYVPYPLDGFRTDRERGCDGRRRESSTASIPAMPVSHPTSASCPG